LAADGRRIAGFVLVPIPECPTGTTVAFLDAEGNTIEIRNDGPLFEMAKALRPKLAELTLLPEWPARYPCYGPTFAGGGSSGN
jgi:hypothetical protein